MPLSLDGLTACAFIRLYLIPESGVLLNLIRGSAQIRSRRMNYGGGSSAKVNDADAHRAIKPSIQRVSTCIDARIGLFDW
jgi:hypothetical protein